MNVISASMKQVLIKHMAMNVYKTAYVILLLCMSMTIVSSNLLESDAFPDTDRQDNGMFPYSDQDGQYDNGLSLDDIFQHRVDDETQLCPKQFMLLFLITRDARYLKDCGYALGVDKNRTVNNGPKPLVATSSGNILKRILDNMDAGTAKVDFMEDTKGDAEKRARLSINGALSSLVEMLRHESRRHHRRPQYAFHREMLHMG
ncbi:uncharacterized protein LOC123541083 [Mercenaria mercenaria]|uniref:uncharacterized protein LOC123541083 n=1 Tax=Mercenaria mercenaria TaxID=6596 RepID=UPI00234ED61C|nr:uncharacterized protein LOC123541083 [Mercenaria mercenaria]